MEAKVDERSGLRIAHLTTVDISLALLLSTELSDAVQEGHEVIGISAPGPYVDRIEALGVSHVAVPELTRSWNVPQDLRAFSSLWTTLRSLDLDVLHTHTPKAGVMGRVAGRLGGVPIVVNTCHGLWATPEDRWLKRALVYGAEGLAARFSDFELFQNAQDERTLRRWLKPGRHRVVGNGIDLERFHFDPEGRARLRAEWGVGKDEILVGTVGRRVREKGLSEFATAAEALKDRARFVWVGPKDETEADLVDADSPSVTFLPEQTDMPAVYSAFDVFVLASYREGFSRASMEAAACGRALILSDIRGCREIGEDGTHLRLVAPRDSSALTEAVARLIADPDQRARLGAAALERAGHEFDQREIARQSRAAYDDVARGKGLDHLNTDRRSLVMHIVPADLNRGAQVYASQLRDALGGDPQQRHLVVSLFDAPEASRPADIRLGTRSGLMRRAGLDPRAVRRLRRATKNLHADIVVAHGGESLKYVVAAGGDAATVYYKVGLSSAELARPGRRALYRLLAARTSEVVAVSRTVRDQCHEVLGVPLHRMSVIPNGRDPEVFCPPEVGQARTHPQRILWVGRFEDGKRPDVLIDVVKGLRSRGIQCEAMMVGDGPLRESLLERALLEDVALPGVRHDVPELMRGAAVLVMTSAADTEGMPGVLIEAGLSALPVVATQAAGVDDVVVHGQTGFVVGCDDLTGMAEHLGEILTDTELAHRLGSQARQRCLELYSVDSTALRWRRLVSRLRPGDTGTADPPVPVSGLLRAR